MKKTGVLISVILLVGFIIFSSFKKPEVKLLDLNEYFKHARKDIIYPSAKQIEILKAYIPKEVFKPAPSIKNRAYWGKIAESESGKKYLKVALSELNKKPEVPITDSIYKLANKKGDRGMYKPRYYRTMTRLENFILAECIENNGRFIPQINNYLNAIMEMKSWLHPNHDDKNNNVLKGNRVSIDLGARRFGSDLALAQVLLEDKLSKKINNKISEQLKWRIVDTYLTSCKENDRNNRWIKSTSNWNSVCTSGSMFVSISSSLDESKRLAAIGCALNSMKYYLSGFGEDGYCSEGAGYWNYGFGHYLYLAQILYDYTGGKINMFKANNPEKLLNVGNFPKRYQIHTGVCAPFSDGVSRVSNDGGFAYNMSARKYGITMPVNSKKAKTHDSFSAIYQLIEWAYETKINENSVQQSMALPNHTYFDDFGIVISRGKQVVPLSIAIKAGHNKENHNHSDVGSYTIVLNNDIMSGDIGAPSYTAGAFSKDNPARSSWGHPVPRIDNKLQSNGIEYRGVITKTKFTDSLDKVIMDIKPAYEISTLKKLIRTMENDKSELGTISITDEFSSTKPIAFGTAIMTLSKYEIIDNNTIILTVGNQKLKVEVSSNDGALKIKDEVVPVKSLRERGPAYRLGVDFKKPISDGKITIKYIPIK